MWAYFRIEIAAALAATHRKRRKRVLEYLLECEEFENREVDGRVEAKAAFIRTNRAIHLNSVATIDANNSLIVYPRHAEDDDALRLDHAFENRILFVLRICLEDWIESRQNFIDGLNEFRFIRILRLNAGENRINIFAHAMHFSYNKITLLKHIACQRQLPPKTGEILHIM